MKRLMLVIAPAVALTLAGCAGTMPRDGGKVDDHATTLAKCGVGNYTFPYLEEPCVQDEPVAMMEDEDDMYFFDTIDITQEINFNTGSSRLSAADKETLNDVAWIIKSNDDRIARVNIEGYTDATGSEERNQTLSRQRAQAVRAYLVERGVDPSKLTATGYGESMPKFNASTATPEELARNRRVEFSVETYDDY